jgi:glutaredoxin
MNRKPQSILFVTAILFLLSGNTSSRIYKWVDENGKTHFSSRPPTHVNAETVQPKITNIYSSPKLPESSENSSLPISNKKVVMYSAVWCGVCKTAKNYFLKHQIPFKEYDIETSDKGRRDYKKLNGNGVPLILVGKQRMSGFSSSRFESLYGG